MSDIESSDWSEIAANNIQPAPGGWPPNSSPNITYSNGREDMGATKRWWNRANPTVTSGGSANAQTLTYLSSPTAYVLGQTFSFFAGFSNSGATTLNVGGLGAKNIFFGAVPMVGGELLAGGIVEVVYDGTQFHLIGATGGRASAASYVPLSGGTMTGALTVPSLSVANTVANGRIVNGYTGTTPAPAGLRWQLVLGDTTVESGSNNGSDAYFRSYADNGVNIAAPIAIKRSSSTCTFAVAIVNGPSDRSLKENIAPLEGSLDKVMALKGVSFNFIKDAAKRRQIGLVAQDVAPVVPEVMQDFIQPDEEPKLAIDYTRLVPLLVEAIKELTAKVARLEAGLAVASQA